MLGRMYQARDGYLALTIVGEGRWWISGWRLELREEAHLMDFDGLEGFDPRRRPEQNEYERVRMECLADDGSAAPTSQGEAWVYVMTPAQLARAGAVEIFSIPWT